MIYVCGKGFADFWGIDISDLVSRQRKKNHALPDMETVAGDICAAVNFIAK